MTLFLVRIFYEKTSNKMFTEMLFQTKILETIHQIMNRYPKINQSKLEALLK